MKHGSPVLQDGEEVTAKPLEAFGVVSSVSVESVLDESDFGRWRRLSVGERLALRHDRVAVGVGLDKLRRGVPLSPLDLEAVANRKDDKSVVVVCSKCDSLSNVPAYGVSKACRMCGCTRTVSEER